MGQQKNKEKKWVRDRQEKKKEINEVRTDLQERERESSEKKESEKEKKNYRERKTQLSRDE